MKNIIPIIILLLPQTNWAQEDLDVLLNGLHLDAHKGNFDFRIFVDLLSIFERIDFC